MHEHLGNIFRVINVLLCFIEIPILALRMLHTHLPGYKVLIIGIYLFDCAVITANWEYHDIPFRYPQVIVTVALIHLIIGGLMNERSYRNSQ